jgi:hypothetical protein
LIVNTACIPSAISMNLFVLKCFTVCAINSCSVRGVQWSLLLIVSSNQEMSNNFLSWMQCFLTLTSLQWRWTTCWGVTSRLFDQEDRRSLVLVSHYIWGLTAEFTFDQCKSPMICILFFERLLENGNIYIYTFTIIHIIISLQLFWVYQRDYVYCEILILLGLVQKNWNFAIMTMCKAPEICKYLIIKNYIDLYYGKCLRRGIWKS